MTGCKVAYPALDAVAGADLGVSEAAPLSVGAVILHPLFTPGHTDNHHCYLIEQPGAARVLTGDTLLIDGCGRTDLPVRCCAKASTNRPTRNCSRWPTDTIVHPGHDYQGRLETTIVAGNAPAMARLGGGRGEAEFVAIMAALELPYPGVWTSPCPPPARGEIEIRLSDSEFRSLASRWPKKARFAFRKYSFCTLRAQIVELKSFFATASRSEPGLLPIFCRITPIW